MALVVFALWLVVIIGFGAFALDISRIYNENSELRNGADAAALAIAGQCAEGLCGTLYADAETYADANAGDGAAWVKDVAVDLIDRRVTVETVTEHIDGHNDLDMVLAQVVGYEHVSMDVEATAGWGPAGQLGNGFPLIFSKCEWDSFGSPGYVHEDPNGFLHPKSAMASNFAPFAGRYVTVYFHGTSTCHSGPSGSDLPGGFGWLDGYDGECQAALQVGAWVTPDPGASPTTECDPSDLQDMLNTVIPLPYFSDTTGNGNNGGYKVHGIGALYVTGYNFGGQFKQDSTITGSAVCTGNVRCVEGYMIGEYVFPGAAIGGPDLGAIAVELLG